MAQQSLSAGSSMPSLAPLPDSLAARPYVHTGHNFALRPPRPTIELPVSILFGVPDSLAAFYSTAAIWMEALSAALACSVLPKYSYSFVKRTKISCLCFVRVVLCTASVIAI